MKKHYLLYIFLVLLCGSSLSFSHTYDASRSDSHAPLGVMGDHLHKKGEWMASYRYMTMSMDDNLSGSTSLSTDEIFDLGYNIAPLSMTMSMGMFGLMAAPSDKVTLMAMAPYINNQMDMKTKMGVEFNTKSKGLGDVKLLALIRSLSKKGTRAHYTVGVSFPTGSITKTDDTPAMEDARLPYPMQLGSGTYDLLPGYTIVQQREKTTIGGQISGIVRLGENSEGYRLGNQTKLSSWVSYLVSPSFSTSIRAAYTAWGDIEGEDSMLNKAMAPTMDPDLRGGQRLDLSFGINLLKTKGELKDNRLALEIGAPIYTNLNGPQLNQNFWVLVGWQKVL